MKLSAFIASILLPASLAVADDIKVEAVVLEIPNQAADALVKEGRRGESEVWKKVISAEGKSLQPNAKVIARFEVEKFQDGVAQQTINHPEANSLETTYFYRVTAKEAENSTRYIGITLRGKDPRSLPLKTWTIDLAAPFSAEWSLSARHRMKDVSRVVLEKSPGLAELEKASFKWTSLRLLERDRGVGKRETKLEAMTLLDDPDEFYRVEWRHRDREINLSHRDARSLTQGKSGIEVRQDSGRNTPLGETTYIHRRGKGLTWSVRSEQDASRSGSKIKVLNTHYMRASHEPELPPLAVQRPAEQSVTTWEGNAGEGKEQSSRVHVQLVAE